MCAENEPVLARIRLPAILLLALIALGLGACGGEAASAPTAGTPEAQAEPTVSADDPTACYAEPPTVTNQAKWAEIIVYGRVVRVDGLRWNSPDGKEWWPEGEGDIPARFRTVYVEPAEILKGTPAWGTPVAFMVLKGQPTASAIAAVGDTVLVLGRDYSDEGGLYGDVFWQEEAYHSVMGEPSVFVERQGKLVAGGTWGSQIANLDEVRAVIGSAAQ